MNKAVFVIKMDNEVYASTMVMDFYIEVSVKYAYPRGILILKDNDGSLLAQLKQRIGTIVNVSVCESDDVETVEATGKSSAVDKKEFCDLCIVGIRDDCGFNLDSAGGNFTLILMYPWALFKDYTNHAYAAMTASELIKKVVKDTGRGYKIAISDDDVDATDDSGKYPKYKIGQSDDEFLVKNVLPFCSVNLNPAYMFIDDFGNFKLKSYRNMYKQSPKVAFVPPYNSYMKYSDTYNTKLTAEGESISKFISYTSMKVFIGGEEITDQIKALSPEVYVEHPLTRRIIVGTTRQESYATPQNKKIPILDSLMNLIGNTDSRTFINRSVDEAVSLNINANSSLDEMFTVEIDIPSAVDVAPIGSTAHLLALVGEGIDQKKTHWLTGKWVVFNNKHYASGSNLGAYTKVTLARPTFLFAAGKSTLADEDVFYKVGD